MLKTNQGEIFQYCKIIDKFFFYRHVLADWKPTNETTWLFAFSLQCFPNTYIIFRTTVKRTATGKDLNFLVCFLTTWSCIQVKMTAFAAKITLFAFSVLDLSILA